MKKILLLLISLAVVLGATANTLVTNPNANRTLNKAAQVKAPEGVDIITEQPEGEVVTYTRAGGFLVVSLYGYEASEQTGQVKLTYAPDGKTVYIEDPLAYGEGTGVWVKGELSDDGSTISVPVGQYVAYNEEHGYGLIMSWGSSELLDLGDDFYWLMFTPDETVEAVTYAVDPATGTIAMVGSEGDVEAEYPTNLNATGLGGLWSDDGTVATVEWSTVWTPLGDATPAVPANPEALEFFDCGDAAEGFTRFDFNINLEDVDGNPLNSDYVTYSIYTDQDQLFTFDYATYGEKNGFDTDMTEIPYGYSGYDFYLRRVYFYRTNEGDDPMFTWRIGIQVHYEVDGVRNSSDIVYLEVYDNPLDGVDKVDAGKTVASERYFNLAGQEMTRPSGVTIKVTTYSDGTISASKVIK